MRWHYKLPLRFRSLFKRGRVEQELSEELRFHLENLMEENVAKGMPPQEARYAALRELGGVEQIKEECRDMRRVNYLENLAQDLRFGLRTLTKNASLAAVVVLSLGLGIGANTTIFSFVSALLFRPPAVKDSAELLELWNHNPQASGIEAYEPLAYPDYVHYRDHNEVFSNLAGFDGEMQPTSWRRSGEGQLIQGQLVSGNFFATLGVKPTVGRTFLPEEDAIPPQHNAVILSHRFWHECFNSDPSALGTALTLNGQRFTVVGVAPADFTGVVIGNMPDFWAPLATAPLFTHDNAYLTSSEAFWLFGLGRLKSGVTGSQVQANLGVLSRALREAHPENHARLEAATFTVNLVPKPFRMYVAAFMGLLMVVVGMVLLIACANAAKWLSGRRWEPVAGG